MQFFCFSSFHHSRIFNWFSFRLRFYYPKYAWNTGVCTGSKLCKSLNTTRYLSLDKLPRTILHNEIFSHTKLLNFKDCIATLAENFVLEKLELMFILDTQHPFSDYKTIYTIILIPIALMKDVDVDGKSCLLKFCNIYELEKYIQVTYLLFRSTDLLHCAKSHLVPYLRVCFARFLGTLLNNFLQIIRFSTLWIMWNELWLIGKDYFRELLQWLNN